LLESRELSNSSSLVGEAFVAGKLRITLQDGMYQLAGNFDQNTQLDDLLQIQPPLRLDLSTVEQINSLGIQKFLKFLESWGSKPLEYHKCSVSFIWATQIMPAILYHPKTETHERVKSLYMPYRCPSCRKTHDILANKEDLKRTDQGITPPEKKCADCGGKMYLEDDPGQYFGFMEL
jgi:hypothetical protein